MIIKITLLKRVAMAGVVLSLSQPALSASTVLATPGDIDDSIRSLEQERQSIRDILSEQSVTLDEIMAMMADKEQEVLLLMAAIEDKEYELIELGKEIETKEEAIAEVSEGIADTEEELNEATKRYDKNKAVAKRRFQSLQKEEQNALLIYLDAISHSESLLDVIGRINAVSLLLGAQSDMLEHIQQQADEIQSLQRNLQLQKRQLTRQTKELEDLEEKVRSEQDALLVEREEAETLISTLTEEQAAIESAYDGNMDALARTQENLDGQRLERQLLEAEAARMETMSSNIEMGLSSSGRSALESLSRVREGQRDTDTVSQVIERAEGYMGVPYVWGGTTPSGFDCSGLVQRVYASAGITLPRTSSQQARAGSAVSVSDAQPGDLLFWEDNGQVYHVAIYIGGGEYIHAPRPGRNVGITSVRHFTPTSARRVIPNASPSSSDTTASEQDMTPSSSERSTPTSQGDFLGYFEATAYAIGDGLTPSTTTANGTNVANTITSPDGHRIIAVDTSVIPMNTVVRVELPNGESFTAKASDTGSAINGQKIDLLMSSPNEALRFGRQNGIKVYNVN